MTGRRLIHSALRAINAIGPNEAPTYEMFENTREVLNMLLNSWSAEELMPHHYSPVCSYLYAAKPSYVVNAGSAFDSDSICMNQKPVAGGSQSLTINGTYATSGVATPDVPRHVIITSTADDSARTFTVVGTSMYGDYIVEVLTGPNATTVSGVKQFKTVTSVTVDDDTTGRITVGTDYIINHRRPHKIVYAYLRDPDGADTPLMVIDRERYDDIADKDEAGTPTRLFYDRSIPSGEMYLHPVLASGLYIDVNVGEVGSDEHITNGSFASGDTGWTLGSQWAVAAGALTRTPGTGDPILSGDELVTNGTFTGNANGWSLTVWVYGTNQIDYVNNLAGRIAGQILSGPDAADDCYVQYTLLAHSGGVGVGMNGGNVTVTLGGVSGTARTSFGSYADTIAFGNGTLNIVANGDNPNIMRVGVDNVSVQKITGYSEIGADTATQASGDLAIEFTEGSTYRLTFAVTGYAAGSCTPSIGGTEGDAISADGSYSMDIVAGSTGDFVLSASSDFSGTFDNISIVEVVDDTTTTGDLYEIHLDLWLPFVEIAASAIDDDINLPSEYILALRWNLAAEISTEYGQDVMPYVHIRAQQTKNSIKMLNGIVPKPFIKYGPKATVEGQVAANQN